MLNSAQPAPENSEHLLPPSDSCLADLKSTSNTPLFPFNISEIRQICFKLIKSSLPTSLATFAAILTGMTSFGYIGNYGTPVELAGASIASICASMFYVGLMSSLNLAFQIIASQLFGANRHHDLVRTFQKTMYAVTVISVPLFIWLLVVNRLFSLFETNQEINENSEMFLIFSLPSLYFSCISDLIRNYLRSQNYFFMQGAVQVAGAILHFFWCHLFIVVLGMPLLGAAIAKCITEGSIAVCLYLYLHKIHIQTGGDLKWDLDYFAGWPSYLKDLAVIGWNSYVVWLIAGIVGFMVSTMGDEYIIGAFGLASTLSAFLPTLPFGNSYTLQTYLGNTLGAGWKYRAQKLVFAGLSLCLCFGTANVLIVVFWNEEIGNLLTNDPKIKEIFIEMVNIYSLMIIPEAFAEHLCGILRTLGQEKKVFLLSNIVYLAIGIPLNWITAFPLGFGYVGIWGSYVFATYLLFLLVSKIFVNLDWDQAIMEANERIQKESPSKEMSVLKDKEYV